MLLSKEKANEIHVGNQKKVQKEYKTETQKKKEEIMTESQLQHVKRPVLYQILQQDWNFCSEQKDSTNS